MKRQRWWIGFVAVAVLLLVVAAGVGAAETRQGDECIVAADETITSDFYVACNTLTVEGVIEGDLIGGAWSATLAEGSSVQGDVWLVGGQLRIDGTVGQDVHFAGVDLDLSETAALEQADVAAVALNVEVWPGATVPGELFVPLGYQTIIRGTVAQDVTFNGSALVVEGAVDGDVQATVGGGETTPSFLPFPFPFSVSFQTPGLTVRSDGRIGGDLAYSGPAPGNINGRISGAITFDLQQPRPDITQANQEEEDLQLGAVLASYLSVVLTDALSLLAAGIFVVLITPGWIHESAALIPRRGVASFGWGLMLSLIAVPVALLVLIASTLLLVFLAAITLGGFTGMALVLLIIINALVIGGFAFAILFMARLVISDLIGRGLARRLGRRWLRGEDRLALNLLALLIGVLLYAMVTNIPLPWVGLVVNVIGIFIGLGAMTLHGRNLYQKMMRNLYPAPSEEESPVPPPLEAVRGVSPPPPPDSSDRPAPGMSNLPNGFNWWGKDDR
ncbi:MAG: polymer-forming cytoskeletal protein [Anaerolineae bacterium]|nr:polymer-forming cytoskeletal protein [Anaerolineae bacterium]